jgi:hypothetical protein
VLLGGGCLCFSFGAHFNGTILVSLSSDTSTSFAPLLQPLSSSSAALTLSSDIPSSDSIPEYSSHCPCRIHTFRLLRSLLETSDNTILGPAAAACAAPASETRTIAASAQSATASFGCSVCTLTFPSKNKLNKHLTESGHRR